MIVSHANRFIFIHNPKCAGTSFREILERYHDDIESFWYRRHQQYFGCEIDYAHLRLWEVYAGFPRIFDLMACYDTLVLVRSPYHRFISALAQHLTAFYPDLDIYSADQELQRRYAERFIDQELRMERVLGNARFVHFSLQIWYILIGDRRLVRHLLPVPQDDRGWAEAFHKLKVPPEPVGRQNPRGGPLTHLLRHSRILDWIEKFYEHDFNWLRRVPSLAVLTTRPESL